MLAELIVRELPFVEDGDPDVDYKLADLLGGFVDGDVPAIGINHTSERMPGHRGIHHWHRNLVIRASRILEPQIVYDDFLPLRDRALRVKGPTEPHTDDAGQRNLTKYDEIHSLEMKVRLHTADPVVGAKTTFADTAPGYYAPIDNYWRMGSSVNGPPERYLARGYDSIPALPARRVVAEQIGNRFLGQVVNLNAAEVYEFDELPNGSVLFRPRSEMGPVSIHGFDSSMGVEREIYVSDFSIRSQPI